MRFINNTLDDQTNVVSAFSFNNGSQAPRKVKVRVVRVVRVLTTVKNLVVYIYNHFPGQHKTSSQPSQPSRKLLYLFSIKKKIPPKV